MLPFDDEDLTAEDARVDLATLSLITAYGDMFDASKILQALQVASQYRVEQKKWS